MRMRIELSRNAKMELTGRMSKEQEKAARKLSVLSKNLRRYTEELKKSYKTIRADYATPIT